MTSSLSAGDIAKRLGKPKRSGRAWMACCPAHNDKNPSLLIYDRPDGTVWFECKAHCAYAEVRAALDRLGLLPEKANNTDEMSKVPVGREKVAHIPPATVMPVPADAPLPDLGKLLGWPPSAVHIYYDLEARPLFVVARRDHSSGKDIRPLTLTRSPNGGLSWIVRAPPEPRPLYGLDRLAARPTAPVLVVEGEKTADAAALRFPNHVVVTWSGGASAVDKTDWAPLAGRDAILWPDNDEAGTKAMERLAAILTSRNP